jgi:hypothetical protein
MSNANIRPSTLLYAILGLAALVRLWGIAFGLPYDGVTYDALTIEEIQEIHRALKLGAGEYSTVFGKGGLYLVLFVEYGVYFVVSWLLGWVGSGREFAIQALHDRTAIYVIGRVTVAAMGVATCYVAYRIAARLYGERTALATALIGALAYFHAMYSAVVNVDVGATLALWLSVLVYLRFEETGKTRFLVGAGALAAVAVAFKFPGALAILVIGAALVTTTKGNPAHGRLLRSAAIVGASAIVALTIIAPEWITSIGGLIRFNFMAAIESANAAVEGPSVHGDIKSITVLRSEWSINYLKLLANEYNVALTATALFATVLGALRRNRWELILGGAVVVFVTVMSLADRTQPQHYLLPIVPALWILGGRGVMALGKYRPWFPPVALAVIVAVPSYCLVRAAVEKSQLDTRVHAKEWIEANVPPGTKILMDGMRYRLSQGPPLNPDRATIEGKVERAIDEGGNFGRGVSEFALSVYQEAMETADGPKYGIVSTEHGLKVRDIAYYAENCFGYIVTSSMVAGRFRPGTPAREMFPRSAQFYDSLETDPRLRMVHEEIAVPWKKSGPTIRIYQVRNGCVTER